MPMTRQEKVEKIQRLETAYTKTRDLLEKESISQDLHVGTDIAQRWTVICAAYSGLEQSLKFLIADEKHLTIEELIHGGIKGCSNQRYPYRTHDLKWLFCQLKDATKNALRIYYSQFQSLHSYIDIEDLEQFFAGISGNDRRGYQSWRYTLIEDEKRLPKISVEAMISVWGVCVEIGESRIFEKAPVRRLDEQLCSQFWWCFENHINQVSVRRQELGEPFQDLISEVNSQFSHTGHSLNFFAQILWHHDRYNSHGLAGISDQLSEVIKLWVNSILQTRENTGMSSHRWFVERALGSTSDGESIKFNSETRCFENVPWSLSSQYQESLPKDAFEVRNPSSYRSLGSLRLAAKESALEIRENCAFAGDTSSDREYWHCVMDISDSVRDMSVLTIWQKKKTVRQGFHFVEKCPRELMGRPIQHWIRTNIPLEFSTK